MGFFRFRRSFKILPGVRLNIGKGSVSVSLGPKGLKYITGIRGSRITVGLPGMGLTYTEILRRLDREGIDGRGGGS